MYIFDILNIYDIICYRKNWKVWGLLDNKHKKGSQVNKTVKSTENIRFGKRVYESSNNTRNTKTSGNSDDYIIGLNKKKKSKAN